MFNDQLDAAIAFYTATFPDSEVRNVARTGTDGPIVSAEFVVGGQVFMGCNGGPYFAFSEGFSLYVDCEDQAGVEKVKAVMDAMMTMVKLDVAALERAYDEA
ncbi:MAG: VOC family protein [Gemmatimonadetes bacterium]|nr:VOC family protein [Gemmatimonadota bacterium]